MTTLLKQVLSKKQKIAGQGLVSKTKKIVGDSIPVMKDLDNWAFNYRTLIYNSPALSRIFPF